MFATIKNSENLVPMPDISEVTPLGEADAPMMQELYEVLRRHQALSRFGVTLLHQHFEVSEDEILVEDTDISNRVQQITPMPQAALTETSYVQTSWRLDSGQPVMICVCRNSSANVHTHFHQK